MTKFTIVMSDCPQYGDDSQGGFLYKFLKAFFSERDLRMLSLADLRPGVMIKTEYLFLGLPSQITPAQIAQCSYQHLCLFDYDDSTELFPNWSPTDRDFLRTLTRSYFKASADRRTVSDMDIHVLPFFLDSALHGFLKSLGHRLTSSLRGRLLTPKKARPYDVCFMGACTWVWENPGPQQVAYHQRVEWLNAIRRRPDIKFWGGLTELPYQTKAQLEEQFGPLSNIFINKGRMQFHRYFPKVLRSKIGLAPTGHARWTYRHFEYMYAHNIIVSNDVSNARTFIPLPLNQMIIVSDHASVLPAIDRILSDWQGHQDLCRANYQYIEQYLDKATFSATRPKALDLFLAQLP